jgi:hypothetical protein
MIILRSKPLRRFATALSAVAVAGIAVVAPPTSATEDRAGGPPPHAQLAAAWWQWVLEEPSQTNPLLDTTGAACANGQPRALVWYLAGTLDSEPVSRSCTVPVGRALFFPMVNLFYGAFLNDPPETRTIEYARDQVACVAGSTGTVTVDGRPLTGRWIVHERSRVFRVQLPEDNIFGLTPDVATDLVLSPSVDEGFYVLLPPLRRGTHAIRIQSTLSPSCPFSSTTDVAYTILVR